MISPLCEEAVLSAVPRKGFRVSFRGSVSSTNLLVKEAIRAGEEPGLVISALKQEGGYGRQGRVWVSPVGGLYTSLFVKPGKDLAQMPSLAPATGLAVARAIDDVLMASGLSCQTMPCAPLIKWPNDVVCAQGKLCGMTVEAVGTSLCVGIGINLFQPAGAMEVGGKNTPAYVADLLLRDDRIAGTDLTAAQRELATAMLQALLRNFFQIYDIWAEEGFGALRQAYEGRSSLVGKEISLRNTVDDQLSAGVVEGFDDQARLLLRTSSGVVQPVSWGEVHIVSGHQV